MTSPIDQGPASPPAAVPEIPEPPPPVPVAPVDDAVAAVAAVAAMADAFARGAAARRQAERAAADDGPLPVRIRDMLLSDDLDKRRAGRRLQLLDHQDGGRLRRRLTLAERARFMAA